MLTPAQSPCIDDLKQRYRRSVPRMFYDYCESGSYTEGTFNENVIAFARYRLRQRVARNIDGRNLATTMIGEQVSMPVALAPVGSTGMQRADGEIHACRAAQRFGVPFTLSTMSVCSLEEVAKHVEKPFWFQLYVMRDREFTANLVARAKAAKCSALVLTLDLQLLGQRHKDIRNGLSTPPKITIPNMINMAMHPGWCLRMAATKNRQFGNIYGHVKDVKNLADLTHWGNTQFDQTLDWSSVEFIRREWGGKLILKGINDVDDAMIAAGLGADAIIVSNHGGRQLDGAPATIDMLGPIVDAVGSKVEVHIDGGIRTGADIMKALALGAKSTYIGRAFIYGLGADGEDGVTRALEILQSEFSTTMALCGERDVKDIGRHNLLMPAAPPFIVPPPASPSVGLKRKRKP
jgi:L-lactate dehydrogenase (cytochrome)